MNFDVDEDDKTESLSDSSLCKFFCLQYKSDEPIVIVQTDHKRIIGDNWIYCQKSYWQKKKRFELVIKNLGLYLTW